MRPCGSPDHHLPPGNPGRRPPPWSPRHRPMEWHTAGAGKGHPTCLHLKALWSGVPHLWLVTLDATPGLGQVTFPLSKPPSHCAVPTPLCPSPSNWTLSPLMEKKPHFL